MVVVVFKITLRPDLPVDEYEKIGARMAEIVTQMPGFKGMDYAELEGGELLVARFESHEALAEWFNHPDHREAQKLGREKYFAHYHIEVCDTVREYEYDFEEAAQARSS